MVGFFVGDSVVGFNVGEAIVGEAVGASVSVSGHGFFTIESQKVTLRVKATCKSGQLGLVARLLSPQE